MNACSVDISSILVSDTPLGLTIGTNLFVGKEPTKPENCVTILDSYGSPPMMTFEGKGNDYYYDAVQIRVRNKDYRTAEALGHNIMVALHGLANTSVSGTLYTVIRCVNGPAFMTWDDNELVHFIMNFDIQRR